MKVVEIFNSIEGEGSRAGYLATFIRLHGCNLRCSYCDSLYACTGDDFKEMAYMDIIDEVNKYSCKRVTITGGEPLIHDDIYKLVRALIACGYFVNIETNGSVAIDKLIESLSSEFSTDCINQHVMFTVDWKSYSSRMSKYNLPDNLRLLSAKDVLKFVVGCEQDLDQMKDLLSHHELNCQVFVSPIFGDIEPKEIVEYLQRNGLNQVRFQLQIHKFVWPADMRGV